MRELETSPSEIERYLICPGCANEKRRGGAYSEPTAEGMFIHEVIEQAVGWRRRSTGSTMTLMKNSRHGKDRALYEFSVDDSRPALISRADGARTNFLRFMEDYGLDPVGEPEGEYTIEFDNVRLVGRYDIKLDAGRRKYVVDLKSEVKLSYLGDNVQMAIAMLGLNRIPLLFDVSSYEAYGGSWSRDWLRTQIKLIVGGVTQLKQQHYSAHWCGRGDVGGGLFAGMEIVAEESVLDRIANCTREVAYNIVSGSNWKLIWSAGFH